MLDGYSRFRFLLIFWRLGFFPQTIPDRNYIIVNTEYCEPNALNEY
jgi:hypothetical protein